MLRVDDLGNDTTIDARVGQSFQVCLLENPTAGYRWRREQDGAPICTLVGDAFDPGLSKPGEPGTHRWTFRVDSAGAATIRMTYRRAWEREDAARTFTLTVRGTAN